MSKYIDIAVIVEPREHKLLIPILLNIFNKIKNIKILVFHGTNNKDFIINNLPKEYFDRLILKQIIFNGIKKDNLTVREYSDLLLTRKFWEDIDGERILIFQTDSCICNYNEDILELCKDYGFVGAPTRIIKPIPWQNGGFSLRKKSLMIKAVDTIKKGEKIFPEDRFFSKDKANICNPAPWDIANKFSVEIHYYDKPFGIHKCWRYQSKENMEKLVKDNKEIKEIFNL